MLLKLNTSQRGAMLITASLFLITLIGLTAVAVDVGHVMIARNELQNAADAAALAGANCLNKTPTSSNADCTGNSSASLNWMVAANKALNSIGLNKADGAGLGSGVTLGNSVATGYKNLLAGPQPGLQPTSLSPLTLYDKPAVMVTLRKVSGQNGGPVQTLINQMYGSATVPIVVNAVAVISSPGHVMPGSLIPQVINKCMYDKFWDSGTGSPKIYTGTPVDPYGLSTVGQPWELRIGSSYHYDACYSGQWTSFDQDVNSQSAVGNLIANGNPTPLAIGDNTWIEPGTKTASYYDLDAKYPTPLSPPTANTSATLDVTVLVVDMPNGLDSKGATPIVAFAGFHIDDIQGGSGKYIQGHFIQGASTSGSGGVGPYYGTYTPPRLAQ